ncbi:MAG TPA: dihydrodipicolinate reductase C-terminal domain-containing protein [Planctomycetota bacterium]
MNPVRIGLFGKGRLGAAIAAAAGERLAWQVAREQPPKAAVDVAIEASTGSAVQARLDWAISTGTPLVIGSTGWQMPDLADRVGQRIGVVTAPNFSLGVALMRRLSLVLARFCALDATRDPYVVEHHQARKHDAPSGTAKLLADTILQGCPAKRSWTIGGPLRAEELSVAVVRAGSTYSEHRVGIDAPAEVLELVHTARSAAAFADGALAAAAWLRGKKGVFTMDAVAASVLDPLFAGMGGNR